VRQRILEGASRAFARSGLQGTSVPDIAAECGISVGLLYRYFGSKLELYTEICGAEAVAEAEGLRLELSRIADPHLRLGRAVDYYLARLSPEGGAGLLLSALAEAPTNELVRTSLRLRRDVINSFITSFIEGRIAAGELPGDLPVARLARAIAMALDGALVEWAVAGGELDRSAVREAILELVGALLRAARDQPARPAAASA
jgi:AcrR family transcriptional regulator